MSLSSKNRLTFSILAKDGVKDIVKAIIVFYSL